MLHKFLKDNRALLIDRCRLMVLGRSEPKATDHELAHGIPIFLDQLIKTLTIEQTSGVTDSRALSGLPGATTATSAMP